MNSVFGMWVPDNLDAGRSENIFYIHSFITGFAAVAVLLVSKYQNLDAILQSREPKVDGQVTEDVTTDNDNDNNTYIVKTRRHQSCRV